jgi:flagellar motor switch protein FliN/FliY
MADETPTNPTPAATPGDQSAASLANDALNAAQSAVTDLKQNVDGAQADGAKASPVPMPAFEKPKSPDSLKGIDLLSDVNLNVKIELGRTRMVVEDVLKLAEGAVVELDKLAGDPVDVYVNERHIARGEVLVLNDNFCVRINEIIADVTDGSIAGAKPKK